MAGVTGIGSPVPVNASGAAATTATFAAAGVEALSAVFTPAGRKFKTSTGVFTLNVYQAPPSGDGIQLATSVPPNGTFTLTVDTTDTVILVASASGSSATAVTTPITVSDTRNTFPGWSVSGQDTTWAGSGTAAGAAISADQLGWTPASAGALAAGVTIGSLVPPVSPGLGSAPAVLASARSGPGNGFGTTVLVANLTLTIPVTQQAGPYSGSLAISAVTTNP